MSSHHPQFQYVTVATKEHDNLVLLKEMAEYHNYPCVQVLGMGDKRLQSWGKGFGVKVHYLKEHVKQLVKDGKGDVVVLFTDAYDVLIVQDVTRLIDIYVSMDSEIVFSAEVSCHPNKKDAPRYPTHKLDQYKTKYLNSGTFIGRADSILSLLNSRKFDICDDDQGYWTQLYLEYYQVQGVYASKLITLDLEGRLFQCMSKLPDILQCNPSPTQGKRAEFFIKPSVDKKPCILHFNGCKLDLLRFYKQWKENRIINRTVVDGIIQGGRDIITSIFF